MSLRHSSSCAAKSDWISLKRRTWPATRRGRDRSGVDQFVGTWCGDRQCAGADQEGSGSTSKRCGERDPDDSGGEGGAGEQRRERAVGEPPLELTGGQAVV